MKTIVIFSVLLAFGTGFLFGRHAKARAAYRAGFNACQEQF